MSDFLPTLSGGGASGAAGAPWWRATATATGLPLIGMRIFHGGVPQEPNNI